MWVVILAGCLVHLTLGTLYTFGNLAPYIASYIRERSHPTDLHVATTTWIYSLALIGQGTSMFLGGWLVGKIGPRLTTMLGCVIMSLGVFLSYFTIKSSFYLLLLTYGLVFGLGVGIAYIGPLTCAMRWLPKWKGVASGFIVGGFGLGALIFDAVQTAFVNPDNLAPNSLPDQKYFTQPELLDRVPRVFLLLGGTYIVMQFVGSLFIFSPPDDMLEENQEGNQEAPQINDVRDANSKGEQVSAANGNDSDDHPNSEPEEYLGEVEEKWKLLTPEEPEKKSVSDESGRIGRELKRSNRRVQSRDSSVSSRSSRSSQTWTSNIISSVAPLQMLRKPNFYMLWFMFLFNGIAVTFTATLYKVFGLTFVTDDHFLAVVGSIASVLNCLGRIVWGLVADATSHKFALVLLSGTMTIFILTFYATSVGGKPMFFIWVCVIFFCIGGNFSLFPTAIGRSFGPKYVSTNYGLLFTSSIISGLLSALLSMVLIGSVEWYGLMFMVSGFSALGFVLALLYRSKRYITLDFNT